MLIMLTQKDLISSSKSETVSTKSLAQKITFLQKMLEANQLKKIVESGAELTFEEQLKCKEYQIPYSKKTTLINPDATDFAQLEALGAKK